MQHLFVVLCGCLVLAALAYFAETEPLFAIQSVEFTPPDLITGIIATIGILWSLWNGFRLPPRVILIPFLLYFCATALSALAADQKLRPAAALIQILEFGVLAWSISLFTSYKTALRVIHFVFGVFVFETVLATWQFVASAAYFDIDNPSRVYPHGTFSNQMKYGEFCAALAVMAYALHISTPKKSARTGYLVVMIVLLFGSIIAHERSPWIAFLISGTLITFLSTRGQKRRALMLKFGAAILAVVMIAASIPTLRESIISRIAEAQTQRVETNTLLSRLMLWGYAWQQFQSHPILGIGSKNFMLLSSSFMDLAETGTVENPDPHNVWLEALCEGGIIGFVTYVSLCLGILALAYSKLSKPEWASVRPLLLGYLGYHLFAMTLSNNYFVKAEGHMHYLMIGLMLGVIRAEAHLQEKANGCAGTAVLS